MVSDVYQIGLLAYELLTGERPYQVAGQEPAEVQRLICGTEVGSAFARVVSQCRG